MFAGEATSQVRMFAGLRRDVWSAVEPELTGVRGDMNVFDAAIRKLAKDRAGVGKQALAFQVGLEKVASDFARGKPFATSG